MKNFKRKESLKETGITIVALVVTIIALLILAGVTIILALSNNGVIGRAQQASNTWANVTKDEETLMTGLASEVDSLTAGYVEREEETSGGSSGTGVTIVAGRGTPEVSIGAQTFATDVANNLSTMKGKWVKYPAGAWSYEATEVKKWMGTDEAPYTNVSNPITSAPSSQGMFGGILLGTWAATGINVATGDDDAQYKDADGNWAWQVLGAEEINGVICAKLMATHITEEYFHGTNQSESVNLFNGQNQRKFRIYENTTMAVPGSGHAMTNTEAQTLSTNQLAITTLPGMASMTNNNYYWLNLGTGNSSSWTDTMSRVSNDGMIDNIRR